MDLGIHVASFTWPDAPRSIAPTLADVARAADGGGFASLRASAAGAAAGAALDAQPQVRIRTITSRWVMRAYDAWEASEV